MDSKKLNEASEHLLYEIDMLNISAVKANNAVRKKIFARNKSDKKIKWEAQVELNISLDSFAIHARNLIEFFKGKEIKGKKYIRAEHYLSKENNNNFKKIMQDNKNLIKYVFDKANHQVTHLTFDRLEPRFMGSNKGWDLKKIDSFNDIIKVFLEMTSEEKLCVNLNKWKKIKKPFHYYIERYVKKESL